MKEDDDDDDDFIRMCQCGMTSATDDYTPITDSVLRSTLINGLRKELPQQSD